VSADDWEEVSSDSPDDWEEVSPAETSPITTATTQLAQGGTLGFGDELAAIGKAGMNAITGVTGPLGGQDLSSIADDYYNTRAQARSDFNKAAKANPKTALAFNIAGSLANPLASMIPNVTAGKTLGGAMANAGTQGAALGATMGVGNSEADSLDGMAKDAAIGGVIGGIGGAAGGALVHGASKGSGAVKDFIKRRAANLSDKAEALAENATGATARQAEKFRPGAGRELLDRGLVRPLDSPAKIAERVGSASDAATDAINDALGTLDASGVKASQDNVVSVLESKIAALKKDPSQAAAARQLQTIVDDIVATGDSEVGISAAEGFKRGFKKAAKDFKSPNAGVPGQEAYRAYMNEVERAATAADPALAAKFKAGKDTYGLLAPIEEATEHRASQLKQHPFGGLGDTAAAVAGGATGGAPGAAVGVLAKRVAAPRLASTAAWTMDRVAKALSAAPDAFGEFTGAIQAAAKRGPQALQATIDILSRRPEFVNALARAERKDNGDRGVAGY
jgi:hypothetical protein